MFLGLCPNPNGQGAGYDPGMSQIRRGIFQRFIMVCLRFGAVHSLGWLKALCELLAVYAEDVRHCLRHMHTTHCPAEGLETRCDADKVRFYKTSHINPRRWSVCQSTR
jgi:hypothetical protein